jgi:hypothetical protein
MAEKREQLGRHLELRFQIEANGNRPCSSSPLLPEGKSTGPACVVVEGMAHMHGGPARCDVGSDRR